MWIRCNVVLVFNIIVVCSEARYLSLKPKGLVKIVKLLFNFCFIFNLIIKIQYNQELPKLSKHSNYLHTNAASTDSIKYTLVLICLIQFSWTHPKTPAWLLQRLFIHFQTFTETILLLNKTCVQYFASLLCCFIITIRRSYHFHALFLYKCMCPSSVVEWQSWQYNTMLNRSNQSKNKI